VKQNIGLFILRVSLGLMMISMHGWGKLMNFGAKSATFPDVIGLGTQVSLSLAVFSEFFCSIFLIAGLLTRWASLPLIATMGVAAFIHHASDPFQVKEKAILYLVGFVVLFFTGAGEYSIDKLIKKD
jgi:putative oxidoreductase